MKVIDIDENMPRADQCNLNMCKSRNLESKLTARRQHESSSTNSMSCALLQHFYTTPYEYPLLCTQQTYSNLCCLVFCRFHGTAACYASFGLFNYSRADLLSLFLVRIYQNRQNYCKFCTNKTKSIVISIRSDERSKLCGFRYCRVFGRFRLSPAARPHK